MSGILRKGFSDSEVEFGKALLDCPRIAQMRQRMVFTIQAIALITIVVCMIAWFTRSIVLYLLTAAGVALMAGLYRLIYETNQYLYRTYAIIHVDLEERA